MEAGCCRSAPRCSSPPLQADGRFVPAFFAYQVPDGSAATDACYWGDMDFVSHIMRLMSKETVHASVTFGTPIEPGSDRKILASRLHSEVLKLKHSRTAQPPLKPEITGEAMKDLAR